MKRKFADILRFLFSFKGRTGNAAYVLFYAALFFAGRFYVLAQATKDITSLRINLVMLAGSVIVVCGSAALTRRLHDTGISGWWAAAGVAVALLTRLHGLAYLFCIAAALVPGTSGPNRFGPPPRGVRGVFLDLRLAALGRAFEQGDLSADEFNARRAALLKL